ncbi:adenylate/guanylate cyclase domain-containing protein [Spirochaeta isovalerica]|uniref:Class 3 adenylate cyclase n=1 Tax=Spirochaeta isovalerica TaxID=150 RepID=A0A841R8M0_9SPIO|nr:adenylate/guanylate cyclase domain-containing protein [Spirochaeta isovalerica]MBB6479701.1 class 3 adenylate cyclase [Spirochaeta isovalerica]
MDSYRQRFLDPNQRAFFIERTGVVLRWWLIVSCSAIQFISPIIPFTVFYLALPLAVGYNLTLHLLVRKRTDFIAIMTVISSIMDIIFSLVLIYAGGSQDIYLWYIILLISHAARFGMKGVIISGVLFSAFYTASILLRDLPVSLQDLALRSLFINLIAIVSGYLAREEHEEFDNILIGQKEMLEEQNRRRELRSMLQRYLSYNIVDELIEHPEVLQPGGSLKKVSVVFSDIKGFTTLLSLKEPEEVIIRLNSYLEEMSNVIFEYGGMVDKFVGDAVIGIFGAINQRENDTLSAVRCALAMQKRLKELQGDWEKEGGDSISFHTRIAIDTGKVIIGNIGSPKRMDFTAIGDTVNTASRLQTVADPDTVVISSRTCEEICEHVVTEDMGSLQLRGKPEPVRVYRVTGLKK